MSRVTRTATGSTGSATPHSQQAGTRPLPVALAVTAPVALLLSGRLPRAGKSLALRVRLARARRRQTRAAGRRAAASQCGPRARGRGPASDLESGCQPGTGCASGPRASGPRKPNWRAMQRFLYNLVTTAHGQPPKDHPYHSPPTAQREERAHARCAFPALPRWMELMTRQQAAPAMLARQPRSHMRLQEVTNPAPRGRPMPK